MAELRSLQEVSPEEVERLEKLARRRGPTDELVSIYFVLGVFPLLTVAALAYLFWPRPVEVSLLSMLILCGGLAVVSVAYWCLYQMSERPKDEDRKQLHHLMQEMRAREADKGGEQGQ